MYTVRFIMLNYSLSAESAINLIKKQTLIHDRYIKMHKIISIRFSSRLRSSMNKFLYIIPAICVIFNYFYKSLLYSYSTSLI